MKTILAILPLLLLACCSAPPRAVVVETKPLVEVSGKIRESSKKVSDGIRKAEESNDKALGKHAEAVRQGDRVAELARRQGDAKLRAEIDLWKRLNIAVGDELLLTKEAFKKLTSAKLAADGDIYTLQGVVSSLVLQANKAGEAQKALEKENRQVPVLKDKLSWWRWAAFLTWLAVAAIIGVWVFVRWAVITTRLSALAISVRSKLPF